MSEIVRVTAAGPEGTTPARQGLALGYVRVSREEQAREGVSLEAQRARIIAYAAAKDLQLTGVYADEGVSGKDLDRPGLQEVLAKCTSGEVRHVVVWKLDRLTRRTRHLLSLIEDLFLAHRIEMHSVSESLDTATPHGRFVLTLFGGLAEMEREQIAERTRSALAWKRENGLPTSHPPLGFRCVGKRERLQPVGEELKVVGEILGLWRAGWGYRSIARFLNARRTPTKRRRRWHHSTISKVVSRCCRYDPVLADDGMCLDTSERACPPSLVLAGGCALPERQSGPAFVAAAPPSDANKLWDRMLHVGPMTQWGHRVRLPGTLAPTLEGKVDEQRRQAAVPNRPNQAGECGRPTVPVGEGEEGSQGR